MKEFSWHNKSVVILLKSFVLSGAEKQALFFAGHLQNKFNCKVYIYSYLQANANSDLFHEECERQGLKSLFVVPNPFSTGGKMKYWKKRVKIALFGFKLRKHKPDIIIPYLNPPSIIAALCYRIAGAKVTFWHHRGPDYYRNDRIESAAVKRTKLFIANSDGGKEELEEVLGAKKERTYSVPNFLTMPLYNKELENKSLSKKDWEGKTVIGMIGHFRQEKLQSLLVKAFIKLREKNEKVHLLLVGNVHENEHEQSYYKEVIKLMKEHQLEKDITILHDQKSTDMLPYLDIGTLISKKEGMPNVVMEYMASKLPVLATNHSGCISLLGEKNAFLVENDVDQIAKKLSNLVLDEELRKRLGQENYLRIKDNFMIQNYTENLSRLIQNHF